MILTLLALVGLGLWVFSAAFLSWRLRRSPLFEEQRPPVGPLPALTAVIAARNQEATLRATVASLLAQDHPDLEVVLVDDRSTDGTAALVDALAAEDARVRALHVADLPAGWLGKVHALDVGFAASRGEQVLMTDADVRFAPGALVTAARLFEAERLDHLAIMPRILPATVGQAVLSAALRLGILGTWRPATADARRYVGIGHFNMVRRAAFAATPGFARIRMDILDDMAVAGLIAEAGGRRRFLVSRGDVATRWYASATEMLAGLEKNAFAALAGYDRLRAVGVILACALAAVLPALAALPSVGPEARLAAGATLIAHGLFAWHAARRLAAPISALLLLPIGLLALAAALARSTIAFSLRRGIAWSGTFYPAKDLIAGRYVRR